MKVGDRVLVLESAKHDYIPDRYLISMGIIIESGANATDTDGNIWWSLKLDRSVEMDQDDKPWYVKEIHLELVNDSL